VLAVLTGCSRAQADESPQVAEAFAICRQADSLPAEDKLGQIAILDRGVALAQAAVDADPEDVRAQLALCCTFGKQVELAGVSWRSFQRLNRLQAIVATAVGLAPEDPDVLVTKGEMLRRVPALLGGDVREAEQLVRRALAKNPEHLTGRLSLAHLLSDRHDPEARSAVALALTLAQQSGTPRERADAWALFAKVRY
jgi:hypothetical protein